MPSRTDVEPDYGRRSVVGVVQERARSGDSRPFALIARSANVDDGFEDFTYGQFDAAADACAGLIKGALVDTADFTTFAWLGPPSDMRYYAMILAAMKTRKVVFFPSSRNSLVAQLSLLESTQCHYFFVPDVDPPAILEEITAQRKMKVVSVPSLQKLAASSPEPVVFTRSFDECRLDPHCILHTSGTTGIPKPIWIKHQYWAALDAYNKLPGMGLPQFPLSRAAMPPSNVFVPSPMFHTAAIVTGLGYPVFYGHTNVNIPDSPLTADAVHAVFQHTTPAFSMLPGPIIKDLLAEPTFHDGIRKAGLVTAAGAPISSEVGDALVKLTDYINVFGMTETCGLPTEPLPSEDYQYHKFSPVLNAEFWPVDNGLFEMVIVRKPGLEMFQSIFTTMPDIDEFHTKDLWAPHPTKPDTWAYRSRLDDIIVFSNGEKLNPASLERSVSAASGVSGALVFGAGQFQAGLLLEPENSVKDPTSLVESVWPTMRCANEDTVAHGQIARDMILVADRDRPFLRSGKGSIQRRMTLELYQKEIDGLFASLTSEHDGGANGTQSNGTNGTSTDRTNEQHHSNGDDASLDTAPAITDALRNLLASEFACSPSSIKGDTDLFSLGMDSLQATNLSRVLNRQLAGQRLTPRIIYNNPTLERLVAVLAPGEQPDMQPAKDRVQAMRETHAALAARLPINMRAPTPAPEKHTVVLVGSTGSLGPYLLHKLLTDPAVGAVHCLNRSADAPARHESTHAARGLTADFSRATFHHTTDLGGEHLGLATADYVALLKEATHVLVNAWPVNFNMPLSSFSPALAGLRGLVDAAALSAHGASVHFLSSISEALESSDSVPESTLADPLGAVRAEGYAESKAVGSALLSSAVDSGVKASTYRVGQIAGPSGAVKGSEWSRAEWLPAILGSARALGCLPADLGGMRVDWIPVDVMAAALAELALHPDEEQGGLRVRNVVNPRPTTWDALLPAVRRHFVDDEKIKTVPFREWVATLAARAEPAETDGDNGVEDVPAAKLVAFFEATRDAEGEAPVFETACGRRESATLDRLGPIDEALMERWLRQWAF